MKTYSFKLNNNTKKNNKKQYIKTNSFSKILSDIISANVINNNPWMKDLQAENDDHITVIKTKNTIDRYDFDAFLDAMTYLANMDTLKDTYDFELIDGTPVKLFSDEIQIGYDLIPIKNNYTYADFTALKPKAKKTIIDIYIKLNH